MSGEIADGAINHLKFAIRRLVSVPTAVILLWIWVLWWGERSVYESSVRSCEWNRWEQWKPGSNPHHVLFIADPQLVDPHTYPGRPWPLSTLTVWYTDLYLYRTYRYVQQYIDPDTTFFLGDLFDGGREWATAVSESPEKQYKGYGTDFWIREYTRFSKIFFRPWRYGPPTASAEPRGRRIIASLPGNHDLGFANGIQPAVKNRFDAYFGPLNRIDVLGNHSFVSVDTVSLSAMDQVDPATGSSGAGDGTAAVTATMAIWKPVEDFLVDARSIRLRAVQRELHHLWETSGQSQESPSDPQAGSVSQTSPQQRYSHSQFSEVSTDQFPSIVLTHVPLFRAGDTSCGPLREGRPAISLSAGYQYQNVLTPLISQDIMKHLNAAEVVQVYSGDDHDYCEIEHDEFTGRIREITVKSMSWAMGVRRPGVQLASLWNPVDPQAIAKNPTGSSTPRDTIQNHLCLLPDQLSIFIRYAQVLGITLVVLIINATFCKLDDTAHSPRESLLPTSRKHDGSVSTISQSSSIDSTGHSSTNMRTAKLGGYGNIPVSSRSSSPVPQQYEPPQATPLIDYSTKIKSSEDATDGWEVPRGLLPIYRGPRHRLEAFAQDLRFVAIPVLVFYAWLLWNG